MKHTITCLITTAVIFGSFLPLIAETEPESQPNASFGLAGSFGYTNTWERKKGEDHTRYNFAPAYGGGFVFEKMFNNFLGIHSGLWVNRLNFEMKIKTSLKSLAIDPLAFFYTKVTSSGWSLSFPLCLTTSLNASFFSFNILAGIKYTHIIDTHMKIRNPLMSYKRYIDILPYVNQPQFGFNMGIVLKFRVALFVDVFAGGIGNLNVTELIKDGNGMFLFFDLSTVAGVMFRTNIFPMRAK
jgi:hypothetical protein